MHAWDYLHCLPGTAHITIGAGEGSCAILMVGTRSSDRHSALPGGTCCREVRCVGRAGDGLAAGGLRAATADRAVALAVAIELASSSHRHSCSRSERPS
jgi:hypothetical protein